MTKAGLVAWIRDSSNQGALVPAWGNVCRIRRGSRRCGAGCGMVAPRIEIEKSGVFGNICPSEAPEPMSAQRVCLD